MIHRGDITIWIFQYGGYLGFGKTGSSAIRSANPEKPHRITKHEVDRMTCCRDKAIWNFPIEVGRQSVLNICTSYTDLIYSSSLR